MSIDDRGARPLRGRERRILDEVEQGLADPALCSALRDGVPRARTPRRSLVALGALLSCILVGVAAVAGGAVMVLGVGGALTAMAVILTLVLRGSS